MGRNKLHVATTPSLFAKLGHVHPFRFTPEAQIKQEDQFPCPLEVLLLSLEAKVQIQVHELKKLLHSLSCL